MIETSEDFTLQAVQDAIKPQVFSFFFFLLLSIVQTPILMMRALSILCHLCIRLFIGKFSPAGSSNRIVIHDSH
jgi:hypothetical protein